MTFVAGGVALRTQRAILRLGGTPVVGDGGLFGVPRDALDFNWLLRLPGSEAAFDELVEHGSPAARIYGACGLHLVGSPLYRSAVEKLASDESRFSYSRGCFGSTEKVNAFVADMLPHICNGMRMRPGTWARYSSVALIR
jgi:hypothetical protein